MMKNKYLRKRPIIKNSCLFFICLYLCFSCSPNKTSEQVETQQELADERESPKEETDIVPVVPRIDNSLNNSTDYEHINPVISADIQKLDSIYSYTPFYGFINGQKFFITRSRVYDYSQEWFSENTKYGLVDENYQELLPLKYSKIGNPNISLQNCFEVYQDQKYGLYNYQTKDVLEPQFDFIIPTKSTSKNTAFGLKAGKVFRITNKSGFNVELIESGFPLEELNLQFDTDRNNVNLMFRSYNERWEDDANMGSGVMIMPSFIEELNVYGSPIIDNIITTEDKPVEFGTETAKATISRGKTLFSKLTSFFATVYNSGISARGYELDERRLLILDNSTNTFNTAELGSLSMYDHFCREAEYELVNDSIVQIKLNKNKGFFYDFETQFSYKKITPDGQIKNLNSDRIYDFTKYVFIDESYFRGCFGKFMENRPGPGQENIWLTDHLTIKQLDIMRNEIFAEYGYKFQTPEWQEYFNSKAWYKPLYDDVNHLLTEIDKANIQMILQMKKKMGENEDAYLNKRATIYVAAG